MAIAYSAAMLARAAALAVLLVACATPTAPTGSSAHRPTRLPLAPATPADQSCEADSGGEEPGQRDRFAFEAGDGRWGFRNQRGDEVIAPRFGFVYEFNAYGLAAGVEPAGGPDGRARFVFIDPSGAVLAEAYAYDNGPDYFQEGLARIVVDGKVGFIDRGGAIAIPARFAGASAFCHDRATVHDGVSTWEIDRHGQEVGPKAPYAGGDDPCGG